MTGSDATEREPEREPVGVAVAQFAPIADTAANVRTIDELAGRAAARGAAVVLFPEYASYFVDPFDDSLAAHAQDLDGAFTTALREIAARHGLVVVAGLVERGADRRVRNAVVAVDDRLRQRAGEVADKVQPASRSRPGPTAASHLPRQSPLLRRPRPGPPALVGPTALRWSAPAAGGSTSVPCAPPAPAGSAPARQTPSRLGPGCATGGGRWSARSAPATAPARPRRPTAVRSRRAWRAAPAPTSA